MMQGVDHNNYEAWLLDRLEGNLDPEQERQLAAFLLAHPELDHGTDDLPTLGDPDASLSRSEKESLKRVLPPTGMPGGSPLDDFLIARLEGDLTPAQEDALRMYLEDHPEHRRAERLYALTKLVPEAMAYAAKRTLERHLPPVGIPTQHTLDDFLVARLEGDLTASQQEALETYLALHPPAAHEWVLMSRTRVPAETVAYPAKADLKKGGKVIPIGAAWATWGVRLRVAATVAVLLGIGMWVLDRDPDQGPSVAVIAPAVPDGQGVGALEGTSPAETPAVIEGSQVTGGATPASVPVKESDPNGDMEPSAPGTMEDRPAIHREPDALLARVEPLVPRTAEERIGPRIAEVPEVGISPWTEDGTEAVADAGPGGIPLAGFLAGKLRKRVLDPADADQRPLDGDDAVAAMDKGLRAVGGEHAGLAIDRKPDGRISTWDLRLGRNLSISASR